MEAERFAAETRERLEIERLEAESFAREAAGAEASDIEQQHALEAGEEQIDASGNATEEAVPSPPSWSFQSDEASNAPCTIRLPPSVTGVADTLEIECKLAICHNPHVGSMWRCPATVEAISQIGPAEVGATVLATALAVMKLEGKAPKDMKKIKSRNQGDSPPLECVYDGGNRLIVVNTAVAQKHFEAVLGDMAGDGPVSSISRMLVGVALPPATSGERG